MAAKDNLSEQLHLFTPPDPDPVVDVSDWARQQQWHSSKEAVFPAKDRDIPESLDERDEHGDEYRGDAGHLLGVHVGTPWAASERDYGHISKVYHPLAVHGEFFSPEDSPTGDLHQAQDPYIGYPHEGTWTDDAANGMAVETTKAIRQGKNILYMNEGEDQGAHSVRAPRQNIRTWSQDVVHNPDSTFAERAAVRRGTELVYVPSNGRSNYLQEQRGLTVKPPRGLKGSPVIASPEGQIAQEQHLQYDINTDEEYLPTIGLEPKFINPNRLDRRIAKEDKKKQKNQLTLDL